MADGLEVIHTYMTSLLFRPTSSSSGSGVLHASDEASDFYLTLPPINHSEVGGGGSRHGRLFPRNQEIPPEELLAVTDFEEGDDTKSSHFHRESNNSQDNHLLVPNVFRKTSTGSDISDCSSCASNSFISYPVRRKTVAELL